MEELIRRVKEVKAWPDSPKKEEALEILTKEVPMLLKKTVKAKLLNIIVELIKA